MPSVESLFKMLALQDHTNNCILYTT